MLVRSIWFPAMSLGADPALHGVRAVQTTGGYTSIDVISIDAGRNGYSTAVVPLMAGVNAVEVDIYRTNTADLEDTYWQVELREFGEDLELDSAPTVSEYGLLIPAGASAYNVGRVSTRRLPVVARANRSMSVVVARDVSVVSGSYVALLVGIDVRLYR